MGTPEFSIPTLKVLKKSKHKIVCVYTQPPKKKSRGQKILKTAVHVFSENEGIKVNTNNLNSENEYKNFMNLNPDLVVVVAYGQIIPDIYLKKKDLIFLNLHASLLPKWRGAAPIERAVLNKDKETGISIMKIIPELDAGPFMIQEKIKIEKSDNFKSLSDKLAILGSSLTTKALDLIETNTFNFKEQDNAAATYAKKVDKNETEIKWNLPAKNLIAKINGLSPYPGVWFKHQDVRIKILKAIEIKQSGEIGEILDNNLTVACKENAIQILSVQKAGKKILNTKEFLSGYSIKKGEKLI